MRPMLFACAVLLVSPLQAADDFRVMKLEQDVRTLEREVRTLQRLVDEARRANRTTLPAPDKDQAPPAAEDDPLWLKDAAWDRIRSGMSELQVIEILGKPTALRPDANDRRALLYTLEIGTTGFLTGSVAFDSGKVVEVQKPRLR